MADVMSVPNVAADQGTNVSGKERQGFSLPKVAAPKVNVGKTERILSMVAGSALALYGLTRKPTLESLSLAAAGGGLLFRGATGHCTLYAASGINTSEAPSPGVMVNTAVTINKPASELYAFWRNFENLPKFMNHLEAVAVADEKRSHWTAKAPLGRTVEWDAEIVAERPDHIISWRSLPGSTIDNAGFVEFRPAPAGRGTEVHVTLEYTPPAGVIGEGIAKLFGEEPSQQISDDLRRFKRLMETGVIATTEGQPRG